MVRDSMARNGRIERRQFLRLAAGAAGLGYAPRGTGWTLGRTAGVRAWRPGAAKLAERTLLVHGEPFPVRGVVYQPTPVGQDPTQGDGMFTAYADPRIRRRDFP